MDTIVRSAHGYVIITPTVTETIHHLVNTKAGFYTIDEIRAVINAQLEPKEQLTRKMIVTSIRKIAENGKQKHQIAY